MLTLKIRSKTISSATRIITMVNKNLHKLQSKIMIIKQHTRLTLSLSLLYRDDHRDIKRNSILPLSGAEQDLDLNTGDNITITYYLLLVDLLG